MAAVELATAGAHPTAQPRSWGRRPWGVNPSHPRGVTVLLTSPRRRLRLELARSSRPHHDQYEMTKLGMSRPSRCQRRDRLTAITILPDRIHPSARHGHSDGPFAIIKPDRESTERVRLASTGQPGLGPARDVPHPFPSLTGIALDPAQQDVPGRWGLVYRAAANRHLAGALASGGAGLKPRLLGFGPLRDGVPFLAGGRRQLRGIWPAPAPAPARLPDAVPGGAFSARRARASSQRK